MLEAQIRDKDFTGIKQLSDAAEFAGQLLTADSLRREFESGAIKRKVFCEALDIGESTLSTWLQTGRIPRVAAVAYVLWLALQNLGNEIRERDESAAEFYVVRCHDGYAVVQPVDSTPPDTIHQVIASFPTVERAQQYAVLHSKGFRKFIEGPLDELSVHEEQYHHDQDNWVKPLKADLERALGLLNWSGDSKGSV